MRVLKIPKKTPGKFRTIYDPNEEEREKLQKHMPFLQNREWSSHVMAFVAGRNCALNAQAHLGKKYTVHIDLQDFFDTVTAEKLSGFLPDEVIKDVLVDGAARQGLPTSPLVANIAALPMDAEIRAQLDTLDKSIVMTRYADDYAVSFDNQEYVEPIKQIFSEVVTKHGFCINPNKTRLSQGRSRVVTGINCGGDSLKATKKVRRRLRALEHACQKLKNKTKLTEEERHILRVTHGVREWAACRLPRGDNYRKQRDEAIALARARGVRLYRKLFPTNPIPDYEDGDFVITSDPVYKLAAPEFSVACDDKLDVGEIYRVNKCFVKNKRYQVAAILSHETKTLANGVTRHKVRAADFVLYKDNGERGYLGHVQPIANDRSAYSTLHAKLESLGFRNYTL